MTDREKYCERKMKRGGNTYLKEYEIGYLKACCVI
jgi:hypothetical protein